VLDSRRLHRGFETCKPAQHVVALVSEGFDNLINVFEIFSSEL
jgi:hypothetical protein